MEKIISISQTTSKSEFGECSLLKSRIGYFIFNNIAQSHKKTATDWVKYVELGICLFR